MHISWCRSLMLAAGVLAATATWAQADDPACPWQQADPSDEIGSSRTQTPDKVLEAIRLVRTGQVYGLAHVYDEETIPLHFLRTFDVTVGYCRGTTSGPTKPGG